MWSSLVPNFATNIISTCSASIKYKLVNYPVPTEINLKYLLLYSDPNTDETPVAPWKPVVNSQPNEYLDISKRGFITKSDIARGREKFWDFLIANQPKDFYIQLVRG